MNAYLDIGNSYIKYEINSVIEKIETTEENLLFVLSEMKKNKVETVYFSNVILSFWNIIDEFSKSIRSIAIREKMHNNENKFLINSIDELGSDLGAIFFAITEKYNESNCIVVSLGTAYTVSLIKNGFYEGVNMFLSPYKLFNCFFKKIDSKLSIKYEDTRDFNFKIGKNNEDAIIEPLIIGQWKLIQDLVNNLKKEHGINNVIFTGGDVALYKNKINEINAKIVPNLVISGLKTI